MSRIKFMLIALLFCSVQTAMAQGQRISGTVTDEFGPVMMANVVERDANDRIVSASTTDVNGNFSMTIKNNKNHLTVSYVGAKTVKLAIGAKTRFDIRMGSNATQVKEVTVTSKRKSNSGGLNIPKREVSVAQQTFDMANVEGLSFTSADEALQGRIAGLDIVANSGNLGAGTTMRLRGVTTINGNAEPLIVVDDQIMDNPDETFDFESATEEQYAALLSVNVEDIASINVLKDAASTAIWGSKGANGVIEIKTKRGARGKARVAYSYKFSGNWQPQNYKLLNGDDYTMLLKEELYNPTQNPNATRYIDELNYNRSWPDYENWNNNTDWVKEVTQFGQSHDHSVNISGGGEKANFRISAGYNHQTGTIIKQTLDRFTTRLVLDYFVSERIKFSTNFGFTYTNNNKNYAGLLGIAQKQAPNMSVYRQDAFGNNTSEYYIMNQTKASADRYTSSTTNSSYELSAVEALGNPVAIANLAWSKERTYRVTPDFSIQYELLGKDEGKHRLTYKGDVYFDIYSASTPSYYPAGLKNRRWDSEDYNVSYNQESNRMAFTLTNDLTFTPHFANEDWSSTMRFRYQMTTSNSNRQFIDTSHLPPNVTSPTLPAYIHTDSKYTGSSVGEGRSQNWSYNGHISYKSRYSLHASIRADGDSKFGPKQKWAYFPSASARWNIIDEPWMKWSHKVISMLAFRPSWGIVGNAPSSESLFYSIYNSSNGNYGSASSSGWSTEAASLEGLKLDNLKWETTNSYNLGFNLGLFNDKIEAEFEYYYKKTTNLLMKNVKIPSSSGYSQLAYANVGAMTNRGWELNVEFNKILKIGKLEMSANVNVAQNYNEIAEMDDKVLESINGEWDFSHNGAYYSGSRLVGSYLNRVQVGNPLGSIYGLKYKGVYMYSYDWLINYQKEQLNADPNFDFRGFLNNFLHGTLPESFYAQNGLPVGKKLTAPIAVDQDGNVLMQNDGTPKHIIYNYKGAGTSANYQFQGGDAIYEDVNGDGNINQLDIMYLGSSLPKVNGGFGLTFRYGNWTLRTSFNYRFGNKVINLARMNLQKMSTTENQTAAVNYRWRKDGDITPMPRAMYGETIAWNYLASDRYVEDAGYVRFQYAQLTYKVPTKVIKSIGLRDLKFYLSGNNLFCWTKYSGSDPEHSVSGWGVAVDDSQTPRAKSFTVGVNVTL